MTSTAHDLGLCGINVADPCPQCGPESSSAPDLTTLSGRMRYAAGVLEEATARDLCNTPVWHPDSLRAVAARLDLT